VPPSCLKLSGAAFWVNAWAGILPPVAFDCHSRIKCLAGACGWELL